MLSEKVLFAINDLDSKQIEETGLRMGYIKSRTSKKYTGNLKRAIVLAAVVAAFLAIGITAYAASRLWSKSMQQQVQATEQQERQLENNGLASVFTGEEGAVSCNGVTIKPLELIVDEYNIRLSFSIDGLELESGFEPCIMAWDWYVGDDPSSGRLNGSGGFWFEIGEDGKPNFTNSDGVLEYNLGLSGRYPDEPVLGQTLHIKFTGLGQAKKIERTQTVEGEWSFEFELPEECPTISYTVNTPVEGTELTMKTVELSPLSIIIEYSSSGSGDPAKVIDTMPRIFHLKMDDGSFIENISNGGSAGYTDNSYSIVFNASSLTQVIDPERVTAVILAQPDDKLETVEIAIR